MNAGRVSGHTRCRHGSAVPGVERRARGVRLHEVIDVRRPVRFCGVVSQMPLVREQVSPTCGDVLTPSVLKSTIVQERKDQVWQHLLSDGRRHAAPPPTQRVCRLPTGCATRWTSLSNGSAGVFQDLPFSQEERGKTSGFRKTENDERCSQAHVLMRAISVRILRAALSLTRPHVLLVPVPFV
jgi:hypothetical protein